MNIVRPPALHHRLPTNNVNRGRSIMGPDRIAPDGVTSADRSTAKHRGKSVKLRLGHAHLKVRNLNRSVPFYTRVLGLRLTEWVGRYAFLATENEHHSIALEEVGDWAVNPSRRATGVAHIAFEVPNREAFALIRKKLSEAKLPFISRNNGISWAVRFKDPDGFEIEIYLDRRNAPGGARLWGGRWRPLECDREHEPLRARRAHDAKGVKSGV